MKEQPKELDVLFWLSRTALELIAQGGLGSSLDPLTDDVPNEFAHAIKTFQSVFHRFVLERITDCDHQREVTSVLFQFSPILPFFFKMGSASFRRRMLELVPLQVAQRAREISDSIKRCSQEIFDAKKQALKEGDEAVSQQVGEGRDIMSKLRQYLFAMFLANTFTDQNSPFSSSKHGGLGRRQITRR